MRLASFQVKTYRNILDSTEVAVQNDVTCLVGKNESGKTAVLEALYRLNPVYGEEFAVQDDYPRWRLVADRRKKVIDDAQPITATFDLDSADIEAVEAVLGEGSLKARTFKTTREYGRPSELLYFTLPADGIDVKTATAHFVAALDLSDAAAAAVDGGDAGGGPHPCDRRSGGRECRHRRGARPCRDRAGG